MSFQLPVLKRSTCKRSGHGLKGTTTYIDETFICAPSRDGFAFYIPYTKCTAYSKEQLPKIEQVHVNDRSINV